MWNKETSVPHFGKIGKKENTLDVSELIELLTTNIKPVIVQNCNILAQWEGRNTIYRVAIKIKKCLTAWIDNKKVRLIHIKYSTN